jgi:hypothetical protein
VPEESTVGTSLTCPRCHRAFAACREGADSLHVCIAVGDTVRFTVPGASMVLEGVVQFAPPAGRAIRVDVTDIFEIDTGQKVNKKPVMREERRVARYRIWRENVVSSAPPVGVKGVGATG